MNIINQLLKNPLAILLLMVISNPLLAFDNGFYAPTENFLDTTFTCNESINVSVNENCEGDIDADEIVEGYTGNYSDIDLTIKYFYDTIPLPIPGSFVGETVRVIATHMPSGISCWGEAVIEDKWAPQLTCSDYQLMCFESPNSFPQPAAWDNCGFPNVMLTGETVENSNICEGVTITRTYKAVDDWGNESSPCTQTYTLSPAFFPDLPKDTSWSCDVYNAHPNVINPSRLRGSLFVTGSGRPDVGNGPYCGYNVAHQDVTIDGCGETFTILRTWTVINWCTGEIFTEDAEGDDLQQLIKVFDHSAPSIQQDPFEVNANVTGSNPQECVSMDFLPPANISDNCHSFTQRIITSIGEAEYINGVDGSNGGIIPAPGLELGTHTIIYEAEDECGNVDSIHVQITVKDLIAPVTVCDELTSVSIGSLGQAEVLAEVFDDGSYDNCCLDTFLVRRMDTTCIASDTLFDESVIFCCADVGDTVSVVFRAKDCFGNFNDCMVLVEVEEKLPAELISCPPTVTRDCEFYLDSLAGSIEDGDYSVLEQFGLPEFYDNCDIIYENIAVNVNIDQCQSGIISRSWQVNDSGMNGSLYCLQTIVVEHTSNWVVSFPSDVTIECGDSIPPTGEPEIFFDECELIAVSYADNVFTVVPDACFKIARNWVVVNWCIVSDPFDEIIEESPENSFPFDLNLDGIFDDRTFQDGLNTNNFSPSTPLNGAQPDGFIAYQQIIMVNDAIAPIVECEPLIEVCVFDTSCTADFSLPEPVITDCSPEVFIDATGDLGDGIGPFTNVPLGTYEMTYQVSDHCGNTSFCQTVVEVIDCKAPTAYCKTGLVVGICDGITEMISPEIFNDGSFDNCPGELNFSFSENVNDTVLALNCTTIGFILVEMWVTDNEGNQSFCETTLNVDNPCGDCQGPPLIAGLVTNDSSFPVADVSISLNGDLENNMMTYVDGEFEFEVELGGDYTVTPSKISNPLNGVTTFDLVLISKHILGVQPLDNPYKIIAADANKSGAVTTADLLLLRKLILQIENNFPDGETWRFIKESHEFSNPLNPFEDDFPEVFNFNNLSGTQLNTDFISVKLGDVNSSADPVE